MKKLFLLAAVSLAALTNQARAQVPVTDAAALIQEIKSYVQLGKGYLLQAKQYATEAEHAYTAAQQYLAFVHDPSLGRAMGLINRTGLGNSLPINPMAIASLAQGSTSLQGLLGKLGQLSNASYDQSHIYSPRDGSQNSQRLIDSGRAIGAMQGAAQAAYDDLRAHLPILEALQERAATAQTPKDVQDVQAAFAAEEAWTKNLDTSVKAIEINYRATQDSRVQQDNESLAMGIDKFLEKATAMGAGL